MNWIKKATANSHGDEEDECHCVTCLPDERGH